jgi:chitinase
MGNMPIFMDVGRLHSWGKCLTLALCGTDGHFTKKMMKIGQWTEMSDEVIIRL